MAISKEVITARIEVVGDYKAIQIATDTIVKEDGVEISRSRHRTVLHPSQINYNTDTKVKSHTDTDISNQPQKVQDICNAVWTDEIKTSWKSHQEGQFI